MSGWYRRRLLLVIVSIGSFAILALGPTNSFLAGPESESSAIASSDFTIRLHQSFSDQQNGIYDNATIVLCSNGSGTLSYRYLPGGYSDRSYTLTFSPVTIQHAYDVLVEERVFDLEGRYVDSPYPGPSYIETTTLDVDSSMSAHIEFTGNAMVGTMPESYAQLWNLAGDMVRGYSGSASVDLDAEINLPDPATDMLHFTLNVTNNEDHTINAISWPPMWYAVLVKDSGWTAVNHPFWNTTFLMVIRSYPITAGSSLPYNTTRNEFWWDCGELGNGSYVLMSHVSLSDPSDPNVTWNQYGYTTITLDDGASYADTPPRVYIVIPERPSEVGKTIVLDSYPSDRDDATSELLFRWDFDGDGQWDTDWIENASVSHAYEKTGNYSVRIQVKDSSGLVGEFSTYLPIQKGEVDILPYIGLAVAAIAAVMAVVLLARRRAARSGVKKP